MSNSLNKQSKETAKILKKSKIRNGYQRISAFAYTKSNFRVWRCSCNANLSQASTDTPTPVISDSELTEHDLGFKIDGPAQPRLSSYPKSKCGSKKLSFQAACYSSFPFLEYSVQKDSGFCFSCRHFPTPNADTAFTKVGLKLEKN